MIKRFYEARHCWSDICCSGSIFRSSQLLRTVLENERSLCSMCQWWSLWSRQRRWREIRSLSSGGCQYCHWILLELPCTRWTGYVCLRRSGSGCKHQSGTLGSWSMKCCHAEHCWFCASPHSQVRKKHACWGVAGAAIINEC